MTPAMNRNPRVAGVGAVGAERPQFLVQGSVGRGTGGPILRETAHHNPRETARHARLQRARRARDLGGDPRQERHQISAVERRLPGEEVVERRPHGVDVRAHVQRLTPELLGRGKLRRPSERAALRELRHVAGHRRNRQPEVADLHCAVAVDETVRGLDVAVQDAAGLRRPSPAMICSIASTASAGGSGPCSRTRSFSVPPANNSIAMTGVPAISSLPKM